MPPDLGCCVQGTSRHLWCLTHGVLGGQGHGPIFKKKKKNFKTDLSCKVLPKVSVESIQEKGITYVVFLVLQKETGSCNLSFPFKTLGLVVL